jgi:V/A-type H+-transporting ATPase subunit A
MSSLTPAGGNLKEPVTESTKKAARCFYALSQQRSDSKRYPAIDPIDSYSKYLEYPEVQAWFREHISEHWFDDVIQAKDILLRGKEAHEQINILGDDGVPIDYHVRFWKSEIIDFIILQQDAFDKVDASTPIDRQKYMLSKVLEISDTAFNFDSFEEVIPFFKKIINFMKQMNYSGFHSVEFDDFEKECCALILERKA